MTNPSVNPATEVSVGPVIEMPTADVVALWNSAFAGYITGPVRFSVPQIAEFLYLSNVNQNLSLVAYRDDGTGKVAAGIGMVSRQGGTSRLAGMGISGAFQGQGVGKHLLRHLLEHAQQRGDHTYVLEVFEQNERAVRLYAGAGFRTVQRLMGYRATALEGEGVGHRDPGHDSHEDRLEALDLVEVARVITAHAPPTTPWQLQGTQIARFGPPAVGFRMGAAYAALSNPYSPVIRILGFFVLPDARRQGQGSRLLRTLAGRFPGMGWYIPQIWPEAFGSFWLKHGFTQDPFNQFQMEKALIGD
jgi:ribosomal protein S18 acetylase RimI-like enzyme